MGQTISREKKIKVLAEGIWGSAKHLFPSRKDLLTSEYAELITDTYIKLGGIMEVLPLNYRGWDIQTKDYIVELDDEQHFNRYRPLTFDTAVYAGHKGIDIHQYTQHCKDEESACLSIMNNRKGFWSNKSSERQFIISGPYGILDGTGSSRWRQRAYYDFLRDVMCRITGIPIIRISVHDAVEGCTINKLLETNSDEVLLRYLQNRKY